MEDETSKTDDDAQNMQLLRRLKSRRWFFITVIVVLVLVLIPFSFVVFSYLKINPYAQYVLSQDKIREKSIPIGLVLGAGVKPDGTPYKELQSRLDTAADALSAGAVQKLILSGDNRFDHYDEPQAMINYLVNEKHIDSALLQPDYAGRSTYESCERAAKIFQLDSVVLISAGSHLPRAIFLCRHFGIHAYGIASPVEANNSRRREMLARVKALYNAYIMGEPTVLGEPIPVR